MISKLIIIILIAILLYIIFTKKKAPVIVYARDVITITGYMAVDEDGYIFIYEDKPLRYGNQWAGKFLLSCSRENIDVSNLNLSFKDEPVKVEVTIRTKA